MSLIGVSDIAIDDVTSPMAPTQCEMLCFIQQKGKLMAVDDIVKICVGFYREEEVIAARTLLDRVAPQRLPKRQGDNKCRATVEDIVKMTIDPNVTLPQYFAVDLNRLPPVDINHCDVTAILAELQLLRAEVRDAARLAEEVATLRREMAQMQQLESMVDDVRQDLVKLQADHENFPPLPYCSSAPALAVGRQSAANAADSHSAVVLRSFTDHARDLQETGMRGQQPKKTRPSVIGSLPQLPMKSPHHALSMYLSVDCIQ